MNEKLSLSIMESHLGICPNMVFLGLEVEGFLFSWSTTALISKGSKQIYTPPAMNKCFPSPAFLLSCMVFCLTDLSQSNRYKTNSQIVLIYNYLMTKYICISSFANFLFSFVLQTLIGLSVFMTFNYFSYFFIIDSNPLADMILVKIFFYFAV